MMKKGWEKQTRPSGHDLTGDMAKDNGGSIPDNVLIVPNSRSNDLYMRNCRKSGIKPHPARFPRELPEFFIRFLTDPNDIVMDCFAGSNQTGEVAEELGRRWIAIERSLHYIYGSGLRFVG